MVGANVTINALLVILLIWMTKRTIPVLTTVQFKVSALETTQGQNDSFFSHLPYKCYLKEVASLGDLLKICPWVASRVDSGPLIPGAGSVCFGLPNLVSPLALSRSKDDGSVLHTQLEDRPTVNPSEAEPPWRQPRGKWMVSLVNSHANATSKRWHLWES